jgi:F0F1-type ATP synthase delta subunit
LEIKKNDSKSAETLDNLKQSLLATPTIAITLPFEPTNTFLAEIYTSLGYFGSFTLSVTVNPSILGGIIVEKSGIYIDRSLNTYIDTFFVSNKSYVEELLR